MTDREQWVRFPQGHWLRKVLFQVHLWIGLGLGLYVFAISLSGSAIIYRNTLYGKLFGGPQTVAISGKRLTHNGLKQRALQFYPGYSVSYIWEGKRPNQVVEIWMRRGEKQQQRLFDPYTGHDLGPSVPTGIKVLAWLKDLHTNLLAGKAGREVNGIGACFLTLLCLTGGVLWWPGIESWRLSLAVKGRANWKRLNWDLHSTVGFWTIAVIFTWAVTGALLIFHQLFEGLVGHFTPVNQLLPAGGGTALGDQILRWPAYLHFGSHWGWALEALWGILGLAPAALFVTGIVMWWNRVIVPTIRRFGREGTLQVDGASDPLTAVLKRG